TAPNSGYRPEPLPAGRTLVERSRTAHVEVRIPMAIPALPVRPVRAVAPVRTMAPVRAGAPFRAGAAAVLLAVLALLIGRARAANAGWPSGRAEPVKYYVVASSFNGQPEFLFEIAERFLGSGDRTMEIFNLNKGRLEPGGLRVENPTAIRPGWVLVLPNDAAGDGVHFGPLPAVADASGAAAPGSPQ